MTTWQEDAEVVRSALDYGRDFDGEGALARLTAALETWVPTGMQAPSGPSRAEIEAQAEIDRLTERTRQLEVWGHGGPTPDLEQRVAELEAALREISTTRLPTGAPGRDELRGCHQARLHMQTVARAALGGEKE